MARPVLAAGSVAIDDRSWPPLIGFFAAAARTGHAAEAVKLLDDPGAKDRWRPLREALAACAAGTRQYLRRVAPEIRRPADAILAQFFPDGLDE